MVKQAMSWKAGVIAFALFGVAVAASFVGHSGNDGSTTVRPTSPAPDTASGKSLRVAAEIDGSRDTEASSASANARASMNSSKDAVSNVAPDGSGDGSEISDLINGLSECSSDNTNPTPGYPVAGLWGDSTRPATGWTFAYSRANNSTNSPLLMQVVWHTFYPQEGAGWTWLITDPVEVNPEQYGALSISTPLRRTRLGQAGGTIVGHLWMVFPHDSATRARLLWRWEDDNGGPSGAVYSATQCVYAYQQDAPAEALGPSLSWVPSSESDANPGETTAPRGPYYRGIWVDPSVPGYEIETDEITSTALSDCDPDEINPNPPNCFPSPRYTATPGQPGSTTGYTQFHTISIYDTSGNPVWLTAQMGPYPDWPVPSWIDYPPANSGDDEFVNESTEVGLNYATTHYLITGPCNVNSCISQTLLSPHSGSSFGRAYQNPETGTVGLRAVLPGADVNWPPSDAANWPIPPDSAIQGCPSDRLLCRPVTKRTDRYALRVYPPYCDVPTPDGTCAVSVSWTSGLMSKVMRYDANTGQLLPHGNDGGLVGAEPWGNVSDTLAADERVIYKLFVGDTVVFEAGAFAQYSEISATTPCLIPPNETACSTTVTWHTPDADADPQGTDIYVYRYEGAAGTSPPYTSPYEPMVSNEPSGHTTDTVAQGRSVYYEVRRYRRGDVRTVLLASTESNPTMPVAATISATPTSCPIPLDESTCAIHVTWTSNFSARIFRRPSAHGAYCSTDDPECVLVGNGLNGSVVDNLSADDSPVVYSVQVGAGEVAVSDAVGAWPSSVEIAGDVTSCIVPVGQSSCGVTVSWSTSLQNAGLYRVPGTTLGGEGDRIGGGSAAGQHIEDLLQVGETVHYELRDDDTGQLHAISNSVTAVAGSEGGDASTGSPDAPWDPAPFYDPGNDLVSDGVGAIAGEFRVDEGGNAVYRIPLVAAPGAGGFTPQLALVYNSGGGDGATGTGFSLEGVSAISPCRPSAESGDADVPSADPSEFCLDGQRLLLVSGTHRAVGAVYRTEIDSFQKIKLTSIESVFATGGTSLSAYVFTVQGKDGSTRVFGGQGGTIFGQAGSAGHSTGSGGALYAAQGWLQVQSSDPVGNTIEFQYETPTDGISGELLLRTASYSGGSIVFNYQESPRIEAAYSALGRRQQSQLLNGIEVRSASGSTLRYYEPSYDTTGLNRFRPHLTALKECDRSGGTCYPATTFTWNSATLPITEFSGYMREGLGYHQFGDMNGDKRADLWWTSGPRGDELDNDNTWLHVSSFSTDTGDGTTGNLELREIYSAGQDFLLPDGFVNGGLWELLDINGDGRDDLVYAWNNPQGHMVWLTRLSTGNGLGEEQTLFSVDFTGPVCRDELQEGLQAQSLHQPKPDGVCKALGSSYLADMDGDGLADLAFRAPDGKFWVALRKPNTSTSGYPYSFTPVKAVFLDEAGSPLDDNRCGFATANLLRKEENYSQAADFDGDGRSDLRFIIDARNCVPADHDFRLDVFLSKGIRVSNDATQEFVFQAYAPFGADGIHVSADGIAEAGLELRTLDVNADGLTDVVYRAIDNVWHYRLGGTDGAIDQCIAGCSLSSDRRPTQLLDFDGDGKLDFWEKSGTDGAAYKIHLWNGKDWASESIVSGYWSPDDTWVPAMADFDGDGISDNFYVKPSTGHWYLRRTKNDHQPRGVISKIVNGLGATTQIDYAPLTYTAVYRRDYDAPTMSSGRGSPVLDVAAPTYVVRKVDSSAPIVGSPSHLSAVTYRYAGLKAQGGGRGSLGFRRISSLDAQTGIEVDTYYQQAFPYIGLPVLTQTRRLSDVSQFGEGCYSSTGAATPDASTCMKYVAPCTVDGCEDADLPANDPISSSKNVIKETADQWQSRDSVSTKKGISPIFVARTETLSSSYDLEGGRRGGAISTESVEFPFAEYDSYGNPRKSTTIKSGGGTTVTQESEFVYDNVETLWRLGRLRTALVVTTREQDGTTSQGARQSSFTYDANGLLASEKVEGMQRGRTGYEADTAAPTVANYYAYDQWGNRSATFTCSTTVSEANCRALSAGGGGGYSFHPIDLSTVMRYTKTDYSASQGRFADRTIEVFSAGDSAAQEVESSVVVARNAAGDPTELVDANQVLMRVRYGTLGRKRLTWSETGASTTWSAIYCAGVSVPVGTSTTPCPSGMGLAYRATTETAGGPTSRVFYDVLGRPTVKLTHGFGASAWAATITQYDEHGNVRRTSEPFFVRDDGANATTPVVGASIVWTENDYDELDRPVQQRNLGNGATTTIGYSGLTTVTTLPVNGSGVAQSSTVYKNGLGEVVKTLDANGFAVTTLYDSGGNPKRISRGDAVTSMEYDSLGRRKTLDDPDAGIWTYYVNGLGEATRQDSPRGTCTISEYDGRGRVWRRRDYDAAASQPCSSLDSLATWTYDTAAHGKGGLVQESNAEVTRTSTYDELGRVHSVETSLDGKTYLEDWEFDQFGRPYQHFMTVPGLPRTGEQQSYTDTGYLAQVKSAYPNADGLYQVYRDIEIVNARGQVEQEHVAAKAEYTQSRVYNNVTGQLKGLQAQSQTGGILQNISYVHDLLGNVMQRAAGEGPQRPVEEFTYDALQRLTESKVTYATTTLYTRGQSYHQNGNFDYKNDAGTYVYGTRPSGCASDSVPGPHAVSDVGATWMCYDANGNVVKQINKQTGQRVQTIQYNAADQAVDLVHPVNNARAGFRYGPNRERVRRLYYAGASAGTASEVVHVVGGAEIRYATDGADGAGALLESRRYVGNVIVVQSGSGAAYHLQRQIVLVDALGSTYKILKASTLEPVNGASPMSFDAWGLRRNGTDWSQAVPWTQGLDDLLADSSTHGYTGHEMAESVGVIHMNGRLYEPHFARFLQADPFVQSPGNGQSWNRYSYGFNNPLMYTDPTGNLSAGQWVRTIAAIVITVYSGGTAAGASWGLLGGASLTTGQAFAVVVAGGFAAGAVQTGTLRGALTGAVSAGVFYGIGSYFQQHAWAHVGQNTARPLSVTGQAAKALTHGAAGGVMAELQGGDFGHGFASAGFAEALSPAIERSGQMPVQVVSAAVVGGTASVLAGGKFGNGAVTGAFSYAFNELAHSKSSNDDDRSYRSYDKSGQNYHEYSVLSQICDASQQFGCSAGYVFSEGLVRYPAPGLDGSYIRTGEVRSLPLFGPTAFTVLPDKMMVINETMPGHKLYPGYVERQVVEANGVVYIQTHGVGSGNFAQMNSAFAGPLWHAVDAQIANSLRGIYPPTKIVP